MPSVQIRPVSLGDAASVQDYASDARVAATCNVPHPYPADGGEAFVQRSVDAWAARHRFPFAVTFDGEFCGIVTLNGPDFEQGTVEVDYWIAHPFWGRNIATQAVRLAVQYAQTKLGIGSVFSACWEQNRASIRVLEKNGFRPIGPIVNDGTYGQKLLGEIIERYRLG
ncbi:MAG TPA: GNAT family N-acetyltransferase [Chthoniobacter sp.]|jgi:RimJ/RimL family protein N-acetyltransferase